MSRLDNIARYNQRKINGLCVICGKNYANENRVLCQDCKEKQAIDQKKRRQEKFKFGICQDCPNPFTVNNKYCFSCWVRTLCNAHSIKLEYIDDIIVKFSTQNELCYYTNKLLVPGENASMEHLIPRSRGGSDEPNNIVWCDKRVNLCKGNMTEIEFIELCKLITQNNTY